MGNYGTYEVMQVAFNGMYDFHHTYGQILYLSFNVVCIEYPKFGHLFCRRRIPNFDCAIVTCTYDNFLLLALASGCPA